MSSEKPNFYELIICSVSGITTLKFFNEENREKLLLTIEKDIKKKITIKEYADDNGNRVHLVLPHITKMCRSQSYD